MSSHERDPKKRRVKPVEPSEQTNILDFDEESSDDSDFRIEDHPEISDEDDSLDSQGEGNIDDSSDSNEDESEDSDEDVIKTLASPKTNGMGLNMSDVILQAANHSKLKFNESDAQITICCGCLGDHSDGVNEIVECDGCGATVHEACYGVSDSNSLASTDSVSPTTPWFCESCKAGIREPVCELCPNAGGIFKETDVGKWVHLVCALYVPGVAFGEVDKLTSVTLFEMPYNKWGSKVCSLCDDERFARTGVCIGCDAGMCRTYFHVTCAQKEGFLSEAHSEEVDQADPFYAHCKLHSDKTLVKRRKRNYMALQLRTQYRKYQFSQEGHKNTPEQLRITRKLEKQKVHYLSHKSLKPPPWVPTQKMPRLLTTSASACRKLFRKAELMGINTLALEMQESQITALADIRKKWHIPPAFSVEFIAYYLDRNDRLKDMKTALERYLEENKVLLEEQQQLRTKYDECERERWIVKGYSGAATELPRWLVADDNCHLSVAMLETVVKVTLVLKKSTDVSTTSSELKQSIHKFHSAILSACPTKNLPNIDDLGKPFTGRMPQPMMVPTAAALKMGVGFPLKNIPSGRADRVLSSHANKVDPLLLNECGTCGQRRDQHLLAKCDTCHLYYHLDCLNPPLSRLPKKSKLYGWQCSECDKTSDSEVEEMKTPRRSRSIYSNRESKSDQDFTGTTPPKLKIKSVDKSVEKLLSEKQPSKQVFTNLISELSETNGIQIVVDNGYEPSHKSGKKRRREKHRSRNLDSPDVSREHKRKRKKKSLDIEEPLPHPRITIKIKPIPLPAGEVASESNPQCFYVPNEADDNAPPPLLTLKAAKIDKRDIRKSRNSTSSVLPSPISPDKPRRSLGGGSPKKVAAGSNVCDVCHEPGIPANSVKCDECQKNYHFTCLDPPLKKTPKIRGYSWHCADCDPTGSE